MLQQETLFSRPCCLQVDVHERARLVNWLVYVHGKFGLCPESLFLCIQLVDRMISSSRTIRESELQLLAIVCLLIAAKYQEERTPTIDTLLKSTDYAFSKHAFLDMEEQVLLCLDYRIEPCASLYLFHQVFTYQTYGLLSSETAESAGAPHQVLLLSRYLIELSLLDSNLQSEPPSLLAASSVYAANRVLYLHLGWQYQYSHIKAMGYSEAQLAPLANSLIHVLDNIRLYKY